MKQYHYYQTNPKAKGHDLPSCPFALAGRIDLTGNHRKKGRNKFLYQKLLVSDRGVFWSFCSGKIPAF